MSQPTARQDLAVRPAGLDAGLAALFGADPADVPSAAKLLVCALRELSEASIVVAGRCDDDSWQVIGDAAADGDLDADRGADRGADLNAVIGGVAGGGYPIVRVCEPVAVLAGTGDPAVARAVASGCQWLALIASRAAARAAAAQEAAETAVLRTVIEQLLCVRDLDQLLLSIADRTLNLLDADICGVLLREGDELRMRSCVGNRLVETSRLRMERGQGVAGLVFLTGEPAKVDNYLDDTTISQDFMTLAEQEQTLSALAVPLRLRGKFLGVLEVWRRRPSRFREQDVHRMVTLADVATIAIDNAGLYEQQAEIVTQLRDTKDALENQVTVLRRSSLLQQRLLATVLDGAGLGALVRAAATELSCPVAIYDSDGHLLARHPARSLLALPPDSLRMGARAGRTTIAMSDGGQAAAWIQPVAADGDKLGCVCVLAGAEAATMMDVVTSQVAMACSLALFRQRAASRARAEAMDQVLWDLLQGSVEHRIAARTRASELGLSLTGALRVLCCRIENLEELAVDRGWDTSRADRMRRDVVRALRRCETHRSLILASLRGDSISAIAVNLDRPVIREFVSELSRSARETEPDLRLAWGVSQRHEDPVTLPRAFDEAKTALSAAHRFGGDGIFLYEELGIARLLLGSGDAPDLQAFVREVTGPLMEYDSKNDGALLRTLRVFFDADCSQRTAAERLFVHHKTLRYRLGRIKQLTGLDLGHHEDRMRADLALRLLQVNVGLDEENALAEGQ
jgi:sugar diacid utilization regulator/putative methionine-R-sulfoxide reductase with GAF domain